MNACGNTDLLCRSFIQCVRKVAYSNFKTSFISDRHNYSHPFPMMPFQKITLLILCQSTHSTCQTAAMVFLHHVNLTLKERKFVLKKYWKSRKSTFDHTKRIRDKFEETDPVTDAPRSSRRTVGIQKKMWRVRRLLKSFRRVSAEIVVKQNSLLKEHKMKLNIPSHLIHEFLEADLERSFQFVNRWRECSISRETWVDTIMFIGVTETPISQSPPKCPGL